MKWESLVLSHFLAGSGGAWRKYSDPHTSYKIVDRVLMLYDIPILYRAPYNEIMFLEKKAYEKLATDVKKNITRTINKALKLLKEDNDKRKVSSNPNFTIGEHDSLKRIAELVATNKKHWVGEKYLINEGANND